MKRLALLAFLLAATLWPAAANAAVPCRNKIYNDWYADGKIASTYPITCYRDALKHVQPDARIYSSLVDDIKSALQGALERKRGVHVPAQIGKGPASLGKGSVKGKTVELGSSPKETKIPNQQANDVSTVASSPTSSGGGGIPAPILVLGGLAILLAAVGAVGTGVKRYRSR